MISRCPNCKKYMLKNICPNCGKATENPHPPRFSLEKEKVLSKYRKKAKV